MENEEKSADISFFKKWIPLLVLSLGLAIIIIDGTLFNVSFGYLIRDLNTDILSLQWVITAYSLTIAALMITGGRLGDLFGRKRMFIVGAFIFALGSFVASISKNVGTMIVGESIIEGIGAALMMPATASLLVSTYRGRERAIAMGTWGGIAAASSAVGPILGGWLTTNYSWRWGFRINIVVAAVLIIGSIVIKECRDREEKPNLDILGVVLSSLGLLSVVFGIIESSSYGWLKAKKIFEIAGHKLDLGNYSIVMPSIIIGLILLLIFFLWEKKVARSEGTPLVSFTLFKNSQYTSGLVTTSLMALGQAGLIFSIPIFLQSVRGLDAYHTGLALLPMSLTALFVAPFSAFLVKFITPKRLIQTGLFCNFLALILIRKTLNIDTNASDLIPPLVLYGVSIGLTMAQLSNMTLSAISVEEAGEAAGVNNTFRQIGGALGSAIIGAALLTALSANLSNGIKDSAVIPAQAKNQIGAEVAAQTSNIEFGGGAKIEGKTSAAIKDEIIAISHRATTDSNKLALLYAIFFVSLGVASSFFLPNIKNLEHNQSAAVKKI